MSTESGFSNQKKIGLSQFKTVQQLGSGRFGTSVSPKVLFEIKPTAAIVAVTDIVGNDGQIKYWNIELTGHTAVLDNVMRLDATKAEYDVVRVIDANNFYILPTTDIKPAATNMASILGWVTQRASATGETSVSITSAPTQYTYDGVAQTVIQDNAVPANNRALPTIPFVLIDGEQVPLSKDTVDPTNTIGLPVENVGMGVIQPIVIDFATTPVDDSAWVEILAAVPASGCKKAQIFMGSGEPLWVGIGALAAEVNYALITPGGNGLIDFKLSPSTRITVMAVNNVTVSEGLLLINLIG